MTRQFLNLAMKFFMVIAIGWLLPLGASAPPADAQEKMLDTKMRPDGGFTNTFVDAKGNVIRTEAFDKTGKKESTTTFTRDAAGNTTAATKNRDGSSTTVTNDHRGRETHKVERDAKGKIDRDTVTNYQGATNNRLNRTTLNFREDGTSSKAVTTFDRAGEATRITTQNFDRQGNAVGKPVVSTAQAAAPKKVAPKAAAAPADPTTAKTAGPGAISTPTKTTATPAKPGAPAAGTPAKTPTQTGMPLTPGGGPAHTPAQVAPATPPKSLATQATQAKQATQATQATPYKAPAPPPKAPPKAAPKKEEPKTTPAKPVTPQVVR